MGSEKMSENPADECSGAASERSMEKAQENCKHAQACLKALDRGSTEFDTEMCELRTCGGSFSAEPKSICANTCSWKNEIRVRSRGELPNRGCAQNGRQCAEKNYTSEIWIKIVGTHLSLRKGRVLRQDGEIRQGEANLRNSGSAYRAAEN